MRLLTTIVACRCCLHSHSCSDFDQYLKHSYCDFLHSLLLVPLAVIITSYCSYYGLRMLLWPLLLRPQPARCWHRVYLPQSPAPPN